MDIFTCVKARYSERLGPHAWILVDPWKVHAVHKERCELTQVTHPHNRLAMDAKQGQPKSKHEEYTVPEVELGQARVKYRRRR